MFHGDRRWIVAVAFTVFVWILVMNSVKFHAGGCHGFGSPRASCCICTTGSRCLAHTPPSLAVRDPAGDGSEHQGKGLGGYIHELTMTPFHGGNIIARSCCFPINFRSR